MSIKQSWSPHSLQCVRLQNGMWVRVCLNGLKRVRVRTHTFALTLKSINQHIQWALASDEVLYRFFAHFWLYLLYQLLTTRWQQRRKTAEFANKTGAAWPSVWSVIANLWLKIASRLQTLQTFSCYLLFCHLPEWPDSLLFLHVLQ